MESVLGQLDWVNVPLLLEWGPESSSTYALCNPLCSDSSREEVEKYFLLGEIAIARLSGCVTEEGLVFQIRFQPSGCPAPRMPVEYVINLGGTGASIFVRSGRPVCTIATTPDDVDHEVELPLSFYSVAAEGIRITIPSSTLAQ
ncbi:MAG: hypothetical protein ACTSUU_04460 [Candidatus Thorarchaeota archaeon]